MAQEAKLSMQILSRAELTPVVAQVIANPNIEALDWQAQPVSGVAGSALSGGLGVFRLSGSAQAAGQILAWSVVVKVMSGANTSVTSGAIEAITNPSAWNYWKREILAYRSGILNELSGNLVAPPCYGVAERPNDEWHIWLEDIKEMPEVWTLERHSVAARQLGQFNGSYLAGLALPADQPWMYHGRARDWIKLCEPMLEGFQHYARSDSGRRWLTERCVERIENLLANHESLLMGLERLPVCLCHHDAFRRNLIARDGPSTNAQTVATDWSMIGYGGIGEEIGITISTGLSFLSIAGDQASDMDKITFASYVAGLRDAGWQGDVHLARFGYTTTAALVTGVTWAMFMSGVLSSEEGIQAMESNLGHKLDDVLEQWATIQPFLLDLGDEALKLVDQLK